MSQAMSLLLLSNDEKSDLVDDLFNLGYTIYVRNNINDIIKIMRHHSYFAALIDHNSVEVDVLESILTIRDFYPELPIIIIDGFFEGMDVVMKQKNIFIINHEFQEIKKKLSEVFA